MDRTHRDAAEQLLRDGPYLPIAVARATVHALLALESTLTELVIGGGRDE